MVETLNIAMQSTSEEILAKLSDTGSGGNVVIDGDVYEPAYSATWRSLGECSGKSLLLDDTIYYKEYSVSMLGGFIYRTHIPTGKVIRLTLTEVYDNPTLLVNGWLHCRPLANNGDFYLNIETGEQSALVTSAYSYLINNRGCFVDSNKVIWSNRSQSGVAGVCNWIEFSTGRYIGSFNFDSILKLVGSSSDGNATGITSFSQFEHGGFIYVAINADSSGAGCIAKFKPNGSGGIPTFITAIAQRFVFGVKNTLIRGVRLTDNYAYYILAIPGADRPLTHITINLESFIAKFPSGPENIPGFVRIASHIHLSHFCQSLPIVTFAPAMLGSVPLFYVHNVEFDDSGNIIVRGYETVAPYSSQMFGGRATMSTTTCDNLGNQFYAQASTPYYRFAKTPILIGYVKKGG